MKKWLRHRLHVAIRGEYCKYKTSCLIHFMERKNRPDGADVPAHNDNKDKEKVKEWLL